MKKHYVLVSIPKPSQEDIESMSKWHSIAGTTAARAPLSKEGRRLHESVWLFDRDKDVKAYANILVLCEKSALVPEVRFLTDDD